MEHTGEQEKNPEDSRFNSYYKRKKQEEQFFSNIAYVFRNQERTKRNISFAKET